LLTSNPLQPPEYVFCRLYELRIEVGTPSHRENSKDILIYARSSTRDRFRVHWKFGNSGELSSLVKHADPQRPGHIVGSWISNGSNQAVSADQVQRLAGQSRIGQFPNRGRLFRSRRCGPGIELSVVVDRLTPYGKVPQVFNTAFYLRNYRSICACSERSLR
jgi:hypothetical protein